MSSERFTRWQNNAINQLTFSINIFMGLATAVLGYSVSILTSEKFAFNGVSKCLFAGSILCQLFSLLMGISVVITRTLDFRWTARITRNIQDNKNIDKNEGLREKAKRMGKASWGLFWTQTLLFVIGVLILMTSIFITYQDRIW